MILNESKDVLIEDYINKLQRDSEYLKRRESLYDNIVYLGPYNLKQSGNNIQIISASLNIVGIWFLISIWVLTFLFTLYLYCLSRLVFLWGIPFIVGFAFIMAGFYRVRRLRLKGNDWFVFDRDTKTIYLPRRNISFKYSDILALQLTQSHGPDTFGCMFEILVILQNQVQRQPVLILCSRREQKMIKTIGSILEKDLIIEQYNWKGQKRVILSRAKTEENRDSHLFSKKELE